MPKENIDLKSVKKLNISGKPVKKSNNSKWKNKQSADNRNASAGKKSGKTGFKGKTDIAGKNVKNGKKNSSEKSAVKIKTTKKVNPADRPVPQEWLYLGEESDSLLRLKSTCINICGMDVEYWEEAGVIEAAAGNGFSMDIEELAEDEADDELKKYIKAHNINFVAAVTIRAESYEETCKQLKIIQENAGGFFCIDNGLEFPHFYLNNIS